jgi:starvation-inducible DNA-binding protein
MENTSIFDLEYSKMEKAEIITFLSKLLNSYQVHLHNLRYFSWNVIGQDNFELSQRFRTCQWSAQEHMDQIAVRISLLKDGITDNWNTILKTSEIKEAKSNLTGFEMVKVLVGQLLTLLSIQSDCVSKANELGDYGTELMTKRLIEELEQQYQAFISWLK